MTTVGSRLSQSAYQPYQGPMPFQQQSPFAATSAGGFGLTGVNAPSLGSQGLDAFSGGFGMNMGGMSTPGMMGTPSIAGSTLQLMSQINMMMASVMQGLMGFLQVLMQSVAQRQSQPASSTGENPSENNSSSGTSSSQSTTETGGSKETSGTSSTSGAGTSNEKMKQLAAAGEKSANRINTPGKCLRGVQDALDAVGLKMQRKPSAYMLADDLASDSRFQEVSNPGDLRNLPAGAIVVWDRKSGNPHGHISIALGDGRESASVVRKQITNYGSKYRVFIPKG